MTLGLSNVYHMIRRDKKKEECQDNRTDNKNK